MIFSSNCRYYFGLTFGQFGPEADSDIGKPIRTLANSYPISNNSLANSNLDFAVSEMTSGRGPN